MAYINYIAICVQVCMRPIPCFRGCIKIEKPIDGIFCGLQAFPGVMKDGNLAERVPNCCLPSCLLDCYIPYGTDIT